jgi:hypothetical protein
MGIAIGRIAIGAGLIVAPERAARGWVGRDAGRPGTQVLGRGLGVRDVALGVGGLLALRRGEDATAWLQGAAFADAVDLGATVVAGSDLPIAGRIGTVVMAGGGAVAGLACARAIAAA